MTVYVDLLFGLNFTINYLLLRGTAALGGSQKSFWRQLLAAALGGAYAVATVLPGMEYLSSIGVQALCAALMLLVAFGANKTTFKQALFFFALSFSFGGAVLLLVQLVEPDCMMLGGRAYYAVSFSAMLLLAGACYFLAAVVLRGCGTHTGGDMVPMTLSLDGKTVHLRALRDTGNTLRDPISGQAVLIVGPDLAKRLLNVEQKELEDPAALLQRLAKEYQRCRFRLIAYHAVGVEHGLLLAVRCKAQIGKKHCELLAAFSPMAIGGERFQALWGGQET